MCGIVGVVGQIIAAHERAFKTLLILDALRGLDSTGIAAIGRHVDPRVVKQVGNPYDLMEMGVFNKVMNQFNRALIGHNRFGTQGLVTKKNAHPFEFDKVIGVHNGTLENKWELVNGNNFAVDSEALYSGINNDGIEKTITRARGAWSLVWWDKEEETMNFLRNKERPMWMAYAKKDHAMFFASESWMIEIATSRNEVDIHDPFPTTVNQLYKIPVNEKGEMADFELVEVKGAPEILKYQGGHQGNHPFVQAQQKSGRTSGDSSSKNDRVVPITAAKHNPLNYYIGSKKVCLEGLSGGVDKYGGKYIVCHDDKVPEANVRLYINKKDKPQSFINKKIVADIGKFHWDGTSGYFKVEYSSVKFQTEEESPDYADKQGNMLTKSQWQEKYPYCCWCSSALNPDDNFRFPYQGGSDVLCNVCADDSEVEKYLIG